MLVRQKKTDALIQRPKAQPCIKGDVPALCAGLSKMTSAMIAGPKAQPCHKGEA